MAANQPSATSKPELEPIEELVKRDLSGWAESLYNCTTGGNYLRAGEYYDLIRTLDTYAKEAAQRSETPAINEPMRCREMLEECVLWLKVGLPYMPEKGVDDTNRATGERLAIRPLSEVVRLIIKEAEAVLGREVANVIPASASSAIGDTVPRSRYDACNQDWLNAKAEVEKKQALLTRVGQLLEKHATTAEVIQALSDDALKSYGVLPETDCVIHGKLGSTDGECPRC